MSVQASVEWIAALGVAVLVVGAVAWAYIWWVTHSD